MAETALQFLPRTYSPNTRPMQSRMVRDAKELQTLMMNDARNPETTAVVRAAIARSWCAVADAIRIMRGIPLPGQFRPDELPNKRIEGRMTPQKFIELAKANAGAFIADDEPDTETPTTTTPSPDTGPTRTEEKKESL